MSLVRMCYELLRSVADGSRSAQLLKNELCKVLSNTIQQPNEQFIATLKTLI